MQAEVKANPVYSMNTDIKEKAVIFDIDNTLLNPEQRFRDAIRAGLIDKKGKAIVKGLMSKGKAYQKRNDFLYSDKSMKKDTVIYGAKELVKELSNKGYVIIYLTNRPATVNQKTIKQLESKGFPLSMSPTGDILVKSRGGGNYTAAKYKKNVMIDLLGRYDIEMIFDDEETVLEAAREVGIPGIYPSVASYSNPVKKNPENKTPNTTTDPNLDLDYDAEPDPVTGEQPTVMDTAGKRIFAKKGEKEEESTQTTLFEFNPGSLPNPLPTQKMVVINIKNKAQQDRVLKAEKAITATGLYFDTDITMGKFPRTRTWYLDWSLSGGTAADVIKLLKKTKIPHKVKNIKSATPKPNPAEPKKLEKAKKLYEHMNGQPVDKIEKIKVDVGDVWYKVGEGGCWSIGYVSGKDGNAKNQRFNHIFNEETNDGNLPALYATMPDKGKPMLIIMGGTWKIKTDDSGVAWIYD